MCYDGEDEHHLVFLQFHYVKTFDTGSAAASPVDEFMKREWREKKKKKCSTEK